MMITTPRIVVDDATNDETADITTKPQLRIMTPFSVVDTDDEKEETSKNDDAGDTTQVVEELLEGEEEEEEEEGRNNVLASVANRYFYDHKHVWRWIITSGFGTFLFAKLAISCTNWTAIALTLVAMLIVTMIATLFEISGQFHQINLFSTAYVFVCVQCIFLFSLDTLSMMHPETTLFAFNILVEGILMIDGVLHILLSCTTNPKDQQVGGQQRRSSMLNGVCSLGCSLVIMTLSQSAIFTLCVYMGASFITFHLTHNNRRRLIIIQKKKKLEHHENDWQQLPV